jgi:hypothetical protein
LESDPNYLIPLPLDLLIPGLLPPAADIRLPNTERWLARADVARDVATNAEAWLARRFGHEEIAVAPVTLAVDEAPQPGTWLRADPVYMRVARDTLVLHGAEILEIMPEEARALVGALRELFAPDGLEFRAPRPDRWYVRVPREELPVTTPLAEALGADVFGRLPKGTGRINWASAITEIQMLFATHPVNLAREAERRPPINGVWLWGGGTLPTGLVSPYGRVYAAETFASGLAHLSSTPLSPLPRSLADVDHAKPALAVIDRMDADLDLAWFDGLGGAIARFGTIRVVLPSPAATLVATLTPSARWRLFRRPRALASYA